MTIAQLNPPREDGFPKIVEISLRKTTPPHTNPKDPKFDEPVSKMEKDYNKKGKGILIFKVR